MSGLQKGETFKKLSFPLSSSFSSILTTLLVSGTCLLILGNHNLKLMQVLNFVLVHSIARNTAEGNMTPFQCSEFIKRNGLKNDKVTDGSNFGQGRF